MIYANLSKKIMMLSAVMMAVTQLNAVIEIRRNNGIDIMNGAGKPSNVGKLDDVRVGNSKNPRNLMVNGRHMVMGGDRINEFPSSNKAVEGWAEFNPVTDALALKFVTKGDDENQLGAAWVEYYFVGETISTSFVNVNHGMMVLPCKALQVEACSTFDLGSIGTEFETDNSFPVDCGCAVAEDFFQPYMSYNFEKNVTAISLFPNWGGYPENPFYEDGDDEALKNALVLPKLGDSLYEDDARVNEYSEDDLEIYDDETSYYDYKGYIYYRVISGDLVTVQVVKRDNYDLTEPCDPDEVNEVDPGLYTCGMP